MSSSHSLAIFDIDRDGVEHRLPHDCGTFTHLASCLRIVFGILNTRKGLDAFSELALHFDITLDH